MHTPARDVEEGLGRSGMSPAVPDPPSPLSSLGESWESSNDESIGAVRRDSEALQAVSHPREMPGGVEGVVDLEDEEDGDIVDGFGLLTPVVLEGTSKYGLTDYFVSPCDRYCEHVFYFFSLTARQCRRTSLAGELARFTG